MYTIKQIIENQKNYRELILQWLTKDLKKSKSDLLSIKSDDKYINNQVKKIKEKFKKVLYKKEINRLFFMHPKRNEEFYAWWNKEFKEVVILSYDKK